MSELPEFERFQKIPRLYRDIIVTEKIDGTNAQVYVDPVGVVLAGSRSRWLTPEKDNFGFARWVKEHEEELWSGLGMGRHYGEWWGPGIQRGYGLKEKRFSLFNTNRWAVVGDNLPASVERPRCCDVVPVLYSGPFEEVKIQGCLDLLAERGSLASPGFMRPEGIVVFHTASNSLFKVTLENDEKPKGKTE